MTEIRKYRSLRNRNLRIHAVKFRGNNARDIEEFIGLPVMVAKDKSFLRVENRTIYKGQIVCKRILDLKGNFTMDVAFFVEDVEWFKRKYREIGCRKTLN